MDTFEETFRPCDGRAYDPTHVCSGPFAWNHTILNKAKYRGVKEKKYFDNPINLSWCCQSFHNSHGETRKFRAWFYTVQCHKYGTGTVKKFLMDAPMKVHEVYS